MNELQLHAYGQLAKAIAAHLFEQAKNQDAELRADMSELQNAAWPIYWHQFMSAFESNVDHLRRLQVLRPAQPARWHDCYSVFACPVNEADVIAGRNWKEGPSFDDLLVWFLALFGEFGSEYWGFSTRPNVAFGNGSRIGPALEALASLGYLSRSDAGYVWTDRIARFMERAGMWRNGEPTSVHRV